MPSGRRRLNFNNPLFDSEPERSFHRRLRENQAMATAEELAAQMAELRLQMEAMQRDRNTAAVEAQHEREAAARLQEQLNAIPRNAKQYMHPELRVPESAIVLPEIARTFEIKSHFISLIKRAQFEGKPTECPMEHVKNFTDLCDTISADGVSLEYVLLKAFKWSLTGKALSWLESLPPRSVTTWRTLHDLFMTKFFPPAKTTELRKRITSYHQLPNESFVETWERFKELLRQCPTHGQPPYVLQEIFFQGINAATKDRINLHTDCGFIEMDPDEAWALLDKLTNYDAMYGTQQVRPPQRRLYDPKEAEVDPEVKFQFMQDEINRLKKQVSFFKTSQSQPCQECGSSAHSTSACTNVEQVRAAETYAEANYMRGQYRNQANNFADRNNNYPTWGNYNQG
jgi:hypothetical protein